MPAKIVVVSGSDRGKEMWIEEEVVRIGRGNTCAITLSDPRLPEHAATLEFRDGHYNLYSRMEDEVVLGGKPLASRGFDRWAPGKELQLAGAIVLRLEAERDPRPMKKARQALPPMLAEPAPEPKFQGDTEEDDPTETREVAPDESAKKRSRQMTQILLILVCALGGAYLLMAEGEPDAGPVQSPYAEFMVIVDTIYKKKADDPRYQELRESLQIARTAELRADTRTALKNYGRLRDTLVARLKSSGEKLDRADRDLLEQTLGFVTVRLRTATDDVAAE